MTETVFCTMNVKGLGNDKKRNYVFQWLKNQQYSIYFLKKTHLVESKIKQWEHEWGGRIFCSGTKSNAEGVAILIHPEHKLNIIETKNLLSGRLQSVKIDINEKKLVLINVYGFNDDNTKLLDTLEVFLGNEFGENMIIGGDFNVTLNDEIDKKHGKANTHKKQRIKLNN